MIFYLLLIYIFLNILMLFMFYPMMIMTTLIFQTINVTILIGILNKSFWISYIFFLIIIGGMMILFLYMTSLMSKDINSFNTSMISMWLSIIFLMSIMFFMNKYMNLNFNLNEILNFLNTTSMLKIYNSFNLKITILMMNYLFFCLLVVTKIINLTYGPMRSS
uniref:NADH dehydrogenase subunit 6 n=1 Tax=Adicella ragma TaxID=2904898 RepID=A0A9E8RT18_9NEOP|nr:NADH dehydrogenase subunit 6 [Adicella ragma]UZZ43724.1 NADH dehydrogenase subunit 6 [Adicella ragma]